MARKIHRNQREQIAKRFDGRCAYCGQPLGENWHADHVEPLLRGWTPQEARTLGVSKGIDAPENIVPSCATCNLRKSKMSVGLFRHEIRAIPSRRGLRMIPALLALAGCVALLAQIVREHRREARDRWQD